MVMVIKMGQNISLLLQEGNETISVDINYEVIANATLTANDFEGGTLPSGTLILDQMKNLRHYQLN